jgi:hypothetical protein
MGKNRIFWESPGEHEIYIKVDQLISELSWEIPGCAYYRHVGLNHIRTGQALWTMGKNRIFWESPGEHGISI